MEKQGSTPLQNAVTSNQREPSVIPTGEFNFVPVEDMFDGPETQLADLLANDPGALAQVDLYKADIDRFGIPAMASLGVARPSLATGTFDPVKQQNPATDTYNTMSQILKADSKGAASDVVDPRFASIRQSNFLRYYEHPDFAELGFTPYANMESYYNANSTIWDDMSRMRGEFGSLVGSGFSSVYRSMGDLFDDDAYFSAPDIDSGLEFEDAMAIGNSSRGGALGFTNNLLLNSGYTFGIIGSIAVEELILASAVALQGGMNPVSDAALIARTGMNAVRLGKGVKNFFNISKMQASTRALMNQLKNFDAAKAFWAASKSGGKMIGNVLTPQTFSALKNFKTTKNATQNANNLAKAKAGFGGFYRDFRSLNLALAESKLEGGMVYNELVREGVAIQQKKTGNVTPEQMALIQNQAGEGAFYTTMTNAPLIFLSNQFVLGNAMGGFNRSLGRIFNDTFKKGLNGRLFKGKGVKDAVTGKIKDVFEDAGSGIGGWWTKVKGGGVKGGAGRAISATARYFAANVAEGLQEIGQEAIAVGTKGYYTAVMEDPTAGGIQLQNDMVLAGMGSQFSGQGVETFLSGFLMGGIVQGPQKLVFQGMPALYNKISDPAAYKEYQENKKQYVADLVKVHNEAWNAQSVDAGGVFDINQLSFMVQKQVAAGMKANVFSQDRFGFQDEKDFGKFQQMYTIFETGTSGYFRNQLQDFLQMDDNELGQAFPDQKSQIKSGKARVRIQDMINEIDKQESFYEENKDKFPNPFDRTQYEKDTREYALEGLKEKAHEHARYLYLFTNDGFKRAVERADSIYTSLAQDPLFDKMAANDVTVLLDKDSISNEIGLLLQDIAVQDKDTKEGKEIIKNKSEKLKKLNAFLQVVSDKNNLTKDGSFDRRKINKLTGVFQDYIAFMAKSTNSFTNKDQIKETLKKMVDYYALKGRARVYDKSIEYLNNPARFSEIVDRQLQVNKDIYKNLSKIHKAQIEKYINIKEANMLMNKLFEAGYVGDPEQVKKFLLTGNVNELKTFYDEQGDIDPRIDKVKYDQIQRLLNAYREMSSKDDTSETTEEKGKDIEAQETKSNQDEILEGAGVDVILPESNNTPLLRTLLDRQYRKYSATQTVLGETVKTFEQWRNEEGLEWQNSFNALKKLWVSNSIPTLDAQGNPIFGKLSEKDIASETGFDEWLRTREVLENPLVKEVLDAAGIPLNEMYFTELTETDPTDVKAVASEDDDDIDPANPPGPKVFQPGATADVLKIITLNAEGNVEALFKLVDKLGNNISQELLTQIGINLNAFSDSGSAIAAMRELDRRAPDSTPFPFDGQMLFQGQLVYDKDGKEYRVLTTPKFAQGGTLRLLPNNFEGKPISLQSGQFKNKFSTQELKFDLLPANVARVNVNAINQMYPHVNSVNGKRDYTTGQDDRLNVILDNLTEEEMLNLELVISIDSDRGNDALQFTLKGKETNPYIKIQQSKYKIGLRISNKDTKNKIDSILKERNIPQTDSENGVFAYIPNGIFNMIDPQGNPVDLSNMSREQALNTIFVPKSVRSKLDQKQTLELVRDNFAINQLLLNYADGVMGDNNQLHFATLNTLPFGLNFIAQKGGMSYDNNTVRSLKDLRYDSVDDAGNYFVFDLKKTKGGRTVQFVTTADEGSKLSKKIRENLQKQQLWDDMMAGTDRYYAMVLLPDGNYRAVNLKARELTKGERDDIYVKLVDRAQKTKKENLDKGGKEKDLGFNSTFNEELTDQLFISSKEGFSVSLQVTPWGKLQLQLYNNNTKRQVGKTIDVDIPAADDLTFVDGKGTAINEYVDTLIKDFNNDPDIKAAKVSITNKNLRQSFPSQTSSDIIINSTTTNVRPDVIFNSTGRATAHSSAIQSLKGVQQSETIVVEEVSTEKVEPDSLTAEEAEFSIYDVSEDVFAEYAAGDFVNVPLEFIDHIVNKIVTQGEANLSSREQEILSKRGDTINIKVSRKLEGAPIPTTQQTSGVESNVNLTNTSDLRRKNGSIGTQGFDAQQMRELVTFMNENLGLNIPSELLKEGSELKPLIDYIKSNKELVSRITEYVKTNPVEISTMPDGTIMIEDGNHRANLLNIIGSEIIPTIDQQLAKDIKNKPTQQTSGVDAVSDIQRRRQEVINLFKTNPILALHIIQKEKQIGSYDIDGRPNGNMQDIVAVLKVSVSEAQALQQDYLKAGKPEGWKFGDAYNYAKYDAELAALESTNPLDKVKQKLEFLKAQILEGVAPRDKSKTLRGNEEYQKLLAERKAIEKEANKILSASELTSQDVEDIDVFTKWASENLPSYISIADIDTLGNNLKDGGVRVGAFVLGLNHIAGGQNVSGTIYTGANSPFKYHEAFHGIFRMLLTDEEINNYRGIARKEVRAKLRAEGKNFKQELERFRNSADTYANMTETELQNEYYEEYLADEFEKFKISPKNTNTDAAVKSLFTRILEWIQAVFGAKTELNAIDYLFDYIDSGKFKGAQIANNQFTTSLDVGATIEANAIIPYDSEFSRDETKLGYIYLDSNIADPLVRSISAMFLQRIGELTESYNSKEQLDLVMDDFIWLYDLENPNNENKTEIQKQKLGDIQSAFENYSTEIKEEVVKFVNQISDKADLEEFAIEEFEDETGLRTTSEYDKDASMIGGFRSLSSQLRGYIATTTVESSDYFGNTELKDGEPLIIAVNFTEAYNGLLKSVKNLTNPKEILQSMYFFGQDNAQAGAVVRRMLNDIGITVEQLIGDNTIPLEIQSPLLMQSILKGFENFRVDYLFNERDNLGNTIVYSASERDDINSQLDRWSQGFISMRQQLLSDPKRKDELIDLLADLQTEIIPTDKSISNTKLRKLSKLYSEELFNLSGIKLSPLYIQYSMLYNRSKLESDQKAFLNINKNETPLTHDVDGTMFKESSISIFSQIIQSNNDIFDTGEQGMDSRLKTMAISNAPFDETIGASVFKNPNGDLVYAHQLPTYHLKMIAELNKQGRLEELINSDPYLKNNFLLNSAAFKKLSQQSRLQITRVAGNKVGDILSSEEDLNNNLKDVKQTSTYGDFTPQEFAINLINNYAGLLNNKSYKVSTVESLDDEGNKTLSALAPILIRVMEASNTGDLLSLPVIKTVEMVDGQAKLTEEAVDIYIDKIRTEFARINRAAIESTSVQEDIVGYNNEGGRAFKFFNSGTLMSAELQESLINRAIQAGNAGNVITLEDALAGTVTVLEQTDELGVKEVADGVKIIDNALTSSEEAEIFQMIKPFLESQGSRSNKGKAAPIMIGMGLRWDYKSNNPGKSPVEIKETIVNSQGQRNKYAYYDVSIDGEALGAIPTRLKELMTKATGIDASNYDGAIINIYPKDGFISAHNDVDESVTAINYPVIVANIGGAGSLSVEGAESQKARRSYSSKEYINEPLSSGSSYIFGEGGKNRKVFHRTLPSSGKGNLPQLNVKGQIIPANSYRISVTLRRVKDLEPGMPSTPNKISQTTQQTSEVEVVPRYTNADVKANPNKIYVFGDNTQRTGTGGQAQIRNNENAFGIATKLQPNNSAAAFMSDNDLQSNKDVIDSDIAKIKTDGRSLVFPKDGFGTGLAKLKEKAPNTYAYLKQRLQQEFGFNNDTGVVSKPTQQTSEVAKEVSGMTALRDNVVDNLENSFTEFEQLIDELQIEDQISNQVKSGPIIAAGVSRNKLVQSASLLNMNDNYRHNLKQIFFNDNINTYSINEILLGDQAVSLKDAVDQVKRAKMQNGAYYSAYSAISAPKFGVIHPVEDISLVALEEPEDNGIDIADAQMYMTTKAFRYMWFGFGKLTAAQAELIDRIETLEDITPDSIFGNEQNPQGYAQTQSLLNSKKLVYGDGSTFLKMSAFTLTPGYTSTWDSDLKMWLAKPGMETLHNLRVKLEAIEKEKETIAIAAPLSAIKMKKQRVNLLEELEDTKPFTNGYTTLDARFMGLQQLNPSNKLEQVDPTQIKQILTSEQDDSQFVPALNMDIGQIKEAYNNAISQRVSIKFKDKRNLIFTFDGAMDEITLSKEQGNVTPKLAAFLQYALSGLKASQSSSQILEFFSMTDGVQNYNLNNQITVRKFEQLFLTYFSKGVFSERTPGLGLTLVSDFGNKIYRRVFEIEDGVPVRSEVLRRGAFKGDPNDLFNIDSLTQSNIGSEGVIVLDRLRNGVMEYDSNGEPTGQRYTEMMMPAHHLSVAKLIQDSPNDAMPDVISKMFGVRIPSQDNHSAMNIKWVDFMPSYYGSSAMFARELIEISGADFDIDKVFAQFKDFYVKDNEFYEYGNKNSLEENYSDYVRYVNDKVNQSGTVYSEAFLTYDENLDGAKLENSATKLEAEKFYKLLGSLNIITDAGLAEKSLKALQILGLPITEEQYGNYVEKFGEPYAAPLNNKILDYKYALLGNDAVASGENPISYAPATLDILESTLSTLAEESKLFEYRMLEDNIDVDNLVGKIKAFKANKGASIGAAVLPNLYLSLLTEYGIDLKTPIVLNGVTYDSFKYTKENKDKSNQRKQDTISSLITMATDNAKERLFSKLGLNKHALGIVTMMTSLSIPIRTSILLINNPVIQDLYSQALNKKDKFDPGIGKLVSLKINEIIFQNKQLNLKGVSLPVSDSLLLDSIDFPEEVSDLENISILSKFKELIELGSFTEKMGAPTSLTKGLGKDMAAVMKKKQDIADLLDVDAPLDLWKIYKSDTWNSRYVNLFNELTENLLPEIFLSSSPVFQEILNDVIDNVDSRSSTLQSEDIQNISLDLLSYLNIKGYQYNLLQNGTLNEKTISNELIYPGSNRSIVDVVNNIKTTLESKNETNFFIDNFVTPLSADAVDNYSGLNLAVANTFRNLSALQKIDLQSGFAKLFGSLDTKDDAQTILNYIMVKDGLQVGYQSLLEAIAPFTLNRFLSHINTVEQAVRGDVSFESVFGLSKDELSKEFTEGFLESNINGSKLWTFERSATTGSLKAGVSVADNVVTVNWNATDLKRDAIPNYVRIKDILGEIKTYKLDVESKKYNEIDTYGSNQQTHIGFMFGPRPTYKEVRNFVKAKNGQTQEDPSDFTALMDDVNAIQEEILKAENVNIEATENSIEVQLDPEANMVNVADTALLLEQLGLNQDAQDQSEMEANVIDNVDTSLPQVDEVEAQLTLDFEMELDEQFPTLTDFWDTNIQGNKKAMANLRENNILSLDDFIEEYNTGIYESEESFLDQIKKCNL